MEGKQACKVFCGGLSWETSSERLRAYFENYGVVREAFVSFNRATGRPRGFGFVVFESSEVADKVVSTKHTVDRREVECKKAVPKEEQAPSSSPPSSTGDSGAGGGPARTRKIFVGGLATAVDDKGLKEHFEQFGAVEEAVVMYDHDNKRPRGFGFVTFVSEDSVDKVFGRGVMQLMNDKQVEIKPAVPRDQMPSLPPPGRGGGSFYDAPRGGGYGRQGGYPGDYGSGSNSMHAQGPGAYGGFRGYGHRGGYMGPIPPPRGPPPLMSGGRGGYGGYAGGYSNGPSNTHRSGYEGHNGGYKQQHPPPPQQQQHPSNPVDPTNIPNFSQLYNGANMLQATQALYNLAGFQPHLEGIPTSSSASAKLSNHNYAQSNGLNLKAIDALASSLSSFPMHGDPNTGYNQSQAVDLAAAEAAVKKLTAAASTGDYSNFRHEVGRDGGGFNTSPAPGWSS